MTRALSRLGSQVSNVWRSLVVAITIAGGLAQAQPVADLSAVSVTFNERRGGVYGPLTPKPTITNQGPGNLVINSVYLSTEAPFGSAYGTASVSGPLCSGPGPYTLAPSQSCDIDIIGWTFSLGLQSGFGCYFQAVAIYSNATGGTGYDAANSRHKLDVGFCIQPGPNARVTVWDANGYSPSPRTQPTPPVTFQTTTVGGQSAFRTVRLESTGSSNLTVSSVTSSSPSVVFDPDASYCGLGPTGSGSSTLLADSGSCDIKLVFKPNATGAFSGTVTIVTDALTSPHVVSVTGTGAPSVSPGLSPTSLDLGSVEVGDAGQEMMVTATNNGAVTADIVPTITGANASNFIIAASNCTGVPAGGTCHVTLAFAPTGFLGPRSANLVLTMDAAVSSVPLTGTALTSGAALTITPAAVDFGTVGVGTTSANQTVTLQNTGVAGLVITDVYIPNAMFFDNNPTQSARRCGLDAAPNGSVILAAGQSCTVQLACRPLAPGVAEESIYIDSNAPYTYRGYFESGLFKARCEGTGTFTPSPDLGISLQLLGNTTLANQPRQFQLELSSSEVEITAISFALPLPPGLTIAASPAPTNTCGGTLTALPGATSFALSGGTVVDYTTPCQVTIAVAATQAGTYVMAIPVGQISTANGTNGGSTSLDIRFATSLPAATLSQTSIAFGNWPANAQTLPVSMTVTNTGQAPMDIWSVNMFGNFTYDWSNSTCGDQLLAPGGSCIATVYWNGAAEPFTDTGQVVFRITDLGDVAVPLTGTVPFTPLITAASASAFQFADTVVGQSSSPITVTLTNASGGSLTVGATSVVGGQFAATATAACSALSTAAGTCAPLVTFSPTVIGVARGTLKVPIGTEAYYFPFQGKAVVAGDIQPNKTVVTSTVALSNDRLEVVSLTNISAASIDVSVPVVTGASAWELNSNFCNTPLAPNGTCSIYFKFVPNSVGTHTASVSIAHTGAGSPVALTLSGTALPALVATPASVNFGSLPSGNASPINVVRFATTDNDCFYPSAVVLSGANAASFEIIGDTCSPSQYGVYGTCDIGVRFNSAGANGTRTGSLDITGAYLGCPGIAPPIDLELKMGVRRKSNPLPTTISVPLSAAVGAAGPAFSASPSAVTFAPRAIGSPSAAQVITITNTGAATMTFTSAFVLAGANPDDFSKTTTCTAGLNSGASCTISIVFTPSAAGSLSATLTINTDAPGSPHVVSLSGTGNASGTPIISSGSPSPALLGQAYNFSFAATGTTPMTWSLVTGSLPPGLTLNTSTGAVTGTPTAIGNFAFTINVSNSVGVANLSTAISVASPIVSIMSLSTNTLAFGNQIVGATSAPQVVTVTNTGTGPFSILSFSGIGDFNFSSDCPLAPAVLQANASCNLSVTFTPLTAGAGAGRISVNNNAAQQGTNGNSISLSGTGVELPRANIIVNPSSGLAFGDQAVGSSSVPQVIFVSNTGQAVLELQNVAASGTSFSIGIPAAADNPRGHPLCVTGNTVAPGASCAMAVTFSPVAIGTLTGRLAITHNATPTGVTGTTNINFTGNGTQRREPLIRVSNTIAFNDQILDTVSDAQTALITNIGTATLNLSAFSVTPTLANTNASDFTVSGECATLAPNANCTLGVRFSPKGNVGPKGANLTVVSDATNAPTSTIALLGNAIPAPAPKVQLNPTTVGFGTVLRGTLNATTTLKVTNSGQLPLTITRIDGIPNAAGFSPQSNDCVRTIGVGEFCTIVIRFAPNGPGAQRGELSIISNAPTSPDRVPLTGTGCTLVSPTFRFFVPNC